MNQRPATLTIILMRPGRGVEAVKENYVRLKIVVPQDLSDSDRKHFEKLANTSKFKPRN